MKALIKTLTLTILFSIALSTVSFAGPPKNSKRKINKSYFSLKSKSVKYKKCPEIKGDQNGGLLAFFK